MSDSDKGDNSAIAWIDLTVDDAESVSDFYAAVTGWVPSPVDMGDYSDFNMTSPASGEPMAGVCHARGSNADLPPVWLIYITVEDLDRSIEQCTTFGGDIVRPLTKMAGYGRYCVVRDPAGAVAALFEKQK